MAAGLIALWIFWTKENYLASGLDIGLLVLGGAGVAALYRKDKTREETLNQRALEKAQAIMPGQEYSVYPWAGFYAAFLVLALLASGFEWMAFKLGGVAGLVFGCGGGYLLVVLAVTIRHLQGCSVLTITPQGLSHYLWGEIPWGEVRGIYLREGGGRSGAALVITLSDPAPYFARVPFVYRSSFRFHNQISLGLPIRAVDARTAELVAKRYWERTPAFGEEMKRMKELLTMNPKQLEQMQLDMSARISALRKMAGKQSQVLRVLLALVILGFAVVFWIVFGQGLSL